MPNEFHGQVIALLPRLRVQALALTRNRAAADDLVQDAVANALAAQNSFTPGTNFAAWMHRILRNRFISTLRKQRETTDIEDVPAGAFAVSATHEDRLILKELGNAVNRLPADQREALFMVVLQGMSYEDVAEATGCAVGTAKSRVFRARRQLQTWLTGEESAEATTEEQRSERERVSGRGAQRASGSSVDRGARRSGVGEHHLLA
ncbi:sigma-70 family RNA polymerase sigma factor [Falsiroseomonas sp.]|uniref:sigma-70 family RNA polymerase sigma factor n=1 Tax=Falsiroseomonas sp. TaxID=2870721 RepID=UPI003F6F6207